MQASGSGGNRLALLAGSTTVNAYTNNFEIYDIGADTWDSSNTLTTARGGSGSAGSTTDAFNFGGQSNTYTDIINKINWSTKAETTGAQTIGVGNWGSSMATAPTFAIGMSFYSASYYTTSKSYAYSNMAETARTAMTYKHVFSSAFGNNTQSYAINGNNTGAGYLEKYIHSSNTVSTVATPSYSASLGSGGHSGNSTTGVSISTVSSVSRYSTYSISGNTWTANTTSSDVTYKDGASTCSTATNYYVFGKSTGTSCEKYNYSTNTFTSIASHGTHRNSGPGGTASELNAGVNT